MPALTQLNLNIGTEQNPNMVLHDLHDIRISSTDVNTVTRLLGCDAGVNSIAPLTLANAASLLGVFKYNGKVENPDDVIGIGGTFDTVNGTTYKPFTYAILISFPWSNDQYALQVLFNLSSGHSIAYRIGKGGTWKFIDAI